MKNVTLITKNKIEASVISKPLIERFPFSKKITQNDEIELFLGKFPKEFYIVFDDSEDIESESSLFDEEELKQIPFRPAQFNCLFFHLNEVAKEVIKIISEFYPELIVCDDDTNKFYSCAEFVK